MFQWTLAKVEEEETFGAVASENQSRLSKRPQSTRSGEGGEAATNTLQPATWTWSANSRYLAVTGDFVTNGRYELHLVDFLTPSSPVRSVLVADATLTGRGVGDVHWKDAANLIARIESTGQTYARLSTCTILGSCTQVPNSPGGTSVGVGSLAVSRSGATVVFTANAQNINTFDLFSMPTDGSAAPLQLLPNAPTGRTAQGGTLLMSPDGTKVSFNANYASVTTSVWDVYVVPATREAAADVEQRKRAPGFSATTTPLGAEVEKRRVSTYTWSMSQVTLYLPDELERALRSGAKKAKKSLSAYVAQLAASQLAPREWSKEFRSTFGGWKGDFPEVAELPFEEREPM